MLIYDAGYQPSNVIYYTTNDGSIVNVHDYWEQPVQNYYDKESDLGTMVFKNKLTEIPGISGHPFFFSQTNLLALQLPKSVKSLNHGCFYGCSNLYKVNVEDLVLEYLGYGCFEFTGIKKLDFRNSVFTEIVSGAFLIRDKSIVDYILCPETVRTCSVTSFVPANEPYGTTRIKTLMIPTINHDCRYIEHLILENLIINKFDGLADLHYFETDCIIWVPDEWYDGYVEKYTDNTSVENWQDIISRLRKYSDGVPQFPKNKKQNISSYD